MLLYCVDAQYRVIVWFCDVKVSLNVLITRTVRQIDSFAIIFAYESSVLKNLQANSFGVGNDSNMYDDQVKNVILFSPSIRLLKIWNTYFLVYLINNNRQMHRALSPPRVVTSLLGENFIIYYIDVNTQNFQASSSLLVCHGKEKFRVQYF